jgi:mannosyltransferase OCH1-like enzyme
MVVGIPKIIHQTSSARELPALVHQRIAELKALNPDWEYRYYTDELVADFIQTHFPQYFPAYQSINPKYGAARADLFRYLLMYREGGVYLDIKSTFTRPLDEVLSPSDTYLLSHWTNGPGSEHKLWGTYDEIANPRGEFRQCFIICAPGHPFLAAVIGRVVLNIENYEVARDGVGKQLLHITGPVAYTLAIMPLLDLYAHRLVEGEAELGFVYNFCDSANGTKHKQLFHYHYSLLDEPIVQR